ncbi:MAG: TlyA family RNA methyltransferase [Acidobacteria bacterium]|nr:TlyA family RNA methyltransferase [Acidobacteriota bacterium]
MAKERLDSLLVTMGLAETRQKAKALIMAGAVLVDGEKITKAGTRADTAAEFRVLGSTCPFVSRGGIKLAHALTEFRLTVSGDCCLDIGASTGGFTDCLLQQGATRVFCLDVGRGQLHWKLRTDPRVVVMEKYNARYLDPDDFPAVTFRTVVMDLSFISLRLVLPPLRRLLDTRGASPSRVVCLVKPQFEAGRQEVGKGGIVRDAAVRERVMTELASFAARSGYRVTGRTTSPVTGADGNVEYFLLLETEDTFCKKPEPEKTA